MANSKMSKCVRYTVTATPINNEVRDDYRLWLKNGHVQALIEVGAISADIAIVDTEENELPKVETSYVFPSREALETYFNGAAIALRGETKTRWIDTAKVSFSRRITSIVFVI